MILKSLSGEDRNYPNILLIVHLGGSRINIIKNHQFCAFLGQTSGSDNWAPLGSVCRRLNIHPEKKWIFNTFTFT